MYLTKESPTNVFHTIKGGKDQLLHKSEKDLLKELAVTLNIIHGGQYKSTSHRIIK